MSNDLEERLTGELGAVAYRFPPPPLSDVRARAGRRRRARVARRIGGAAVAVVVVTTVVTSSLTGGDGDVHLAQTPTPIVQGQGHGGCLETDGRAGPGDPRLPMLPDDLPAGMVLSSIFDQTSRSTCDQTYGYAWSANPETGLVERSLRLEALYTGLQDQGDSCRALGAQPAECRRLTVAGESRKILRVERRGERAVWVEAGRVWSVTGTGYDAAEFDALLARLRTDGERFRRDSLPTGLEVWESPESPAPREWSQFTARYVPRGSADVNDPDLVQLTASADPIAPPVVEYADGDPKVRAVDVGGRPGFWHETGTGRTLTWHTADGVLLMLSGKRLELDDALVTAVTVRRVATDDPRLVCAADEGRRGGCG
jgi:hypothetical protein